MSEPRRASVVGRGERLQQDVPKHERVGVPDRRLSVQATAGRNYQGRRSSCTIDPETSDWIKRWDLLFSLALCYTCVVTPYEVAFLEPKLNPLFWVNRGIDFIFVTDICIQFFVQYERNDRVLGVKMVSDRRKIRDHYFRGWFGIDVVSTFPFDMITLFFNDPRYGKLKLMRTLRLLRLMKLVKIVKASVIFTRYQAEVGISYRVLMLFKFFFMLIIIGHWMGCVLGIMGMMNDTGRSWITNQRLNELDNYNAHAAQADIGAFKEPSVMDIYCTAVYWSIMTLTSIGYGDVAMITPQERALATVCMLVGACFWAYIIGNLTSMLASLDAEKMQYFECLDGINNMIRERAIPQDIARRLRNYWSNAHVLKRLKKYRDLTGLMSPVLQGQIAYMTNEFWLKHVSFFSSFSSTCLAEIVQKVDTALYEPRESFGRPWTLYVLNKGTCLRNGGGFVTYGAVWGEDQLLVRSFELIKEFGAVALTFAEIVTLLRGDFEEVIAMYPTEAKLVRKHQLKRLFVLGVLHEARKRRMESDKNAGRMSNAAGVFTQNVISAMARGDPGQKSVWLGGAHDQNPDWDGDEHMPVNERTLFKLDRVLTAMDETKRETSEPSPEPRSTPRDERQLRKLQDEIARLHQKLDQVLVGQTVDTRPVNVARPGSPAANGSFTDWCSKPSVPRR